MMVTKAVVAAAGLRGLVKRAMRKRKIKQQDMAGRVGVSAQYLSDVLRNRRAFTPHLIASLAAEMAVGPHVTRHWNLLAARADGWLL